MNLPRCGVVPVGERVQDIGVRARPSEPVCVIGRQFGKGHALVLTKRYGRQTKGPLGMLRQMAQAVHVGKRGACHGELVAEQARGDDGVPGRAMGIGTPAAGSRECETRFDREPVP